MMKRDLALKAFARHHTNELVVAVYQAAFEWIRIKPEATSFISVGAMGQASSHGLGFALGRPDRRVVVLDGDGSLLMNLGTLVTIANAAPANLVHCVCHNGTYEANGGHPIPGEGRADFVALARAAGYHAAHRVESIEEWEALLPVVLSERGPIFVDLRVEPGEVYPEDYDYMHNRSRAVFRAALARS